MVRRLHAALPQAQIVDHTAALPSGLKEARADIDALQGKVSELASDTSQRDAALKSGIGALQAALAKADTARQADLDALRAELARAVAPSARARLDAWAHTHAIFFTKDTGYRDQGAATAALDELTRLVKETDALVRVVGFTDEKGGQERNVPLSQARAERIVSELKSRGVPASRLVAVGRNNIEDLSPVVGDASPNRRAEFEIGFEGEAPR